MTSRTTSSIIRNLCRGGVMFSIALLAAISMASPVVLAQTAPGARDSGDRLILLGTGGGPLIREKRSQPSSLLIVEGKLYLIDAGVGTVERLVKAGFQPEDIDSVFLTHQHMDHTGGLADVMQFRSLTPSAKPFRVYGPPGTVQLVQAAQSYLGISQRVFASEGLVQGPSPTTATLSKDIVADGIVLDDGVVRVVAGENSHYRFKAGTPSSGVDKSYAYRFETRSGTITFTGDSGPSAALENLASGSDVLVSEVIDIDGALRMAPLGLSATARKQFAIHMGKGHLTPEEVGKLATKSRVKSVVLTHFVPGRDTEHDADAYVTGVRRYYTGPVLAGEDLVEIPLAAPR
jgi:Metal-dependent hydrolases of the beta-lactamase superfamily III